MTTRVVEPKRVQIFESEDLQVEELGVATIRANQRHRGQDRAAKLKAPGDFFNVSGRKLGGICHCSCWQSGQRSSLSPIFCCRPSVIRSTVSSAVAMSRIISLFATVGRRLKE